MSIRFLPIRLSHRVALGALLTLGVASLLLLHVLTPPVDELLSGAVVVKQYRRHGGEGMYVVGPGMPDWVALEDVNKHFIYALLASEDGRFYEHWGIDAEEILSALKRNLQEGRYARGASTITQQLVRMVFLEREKTLERKFREALGALRLEMLLEKDEILEWYINLVDFGQGLYGIRDASAYYFATKPAYLTISEAVHLVMILPSPNIWSYGLKQESLTEFGKQRFKHILTVMFHAGYINEEQYEHSLQFGNFGQAVDAG